MLAAESSPQPTVKPDTRWRTPDTKATIRTLALVSPEVVDQSLDHLTHPYPPDPDLPTLLLVALPTLVSLLTHQAPLDPSPDPSPAPPTASGSGPRPRASGSGKKELQKEAT